MGNGDKFQTGMVFGRPGKLLNPLGVWSDVVSPDGNMGDIGGSALDRHRMVYVTGPIRGRQYGS